MSDQDHNQDKASDKGWADNPLFIRAFLGLLVLSCIGVAAASLNAAWHNPHPHFPIEGVPAFFCDLRISRFCIHRARRPAFKKARWPKRGVLR